VSLYTSFIDQPSFPLRRTLSAIATIIFAVILFRTAWITDDAAITLRTVLNVTHGFGLTFNIAERVQTFTHPLWMGLLTVGYLLIGNVYTTTFALAMILSVLVFWLTLTRAVSAFQAMTGAVVLLFSSAFVDFSTSGLENPLANGLVAAFVAVFLTQTMSTVRRLTLLWTLASLLYLTRPDAVLVVVPLLVVASWRAGTARALLQSIAVGSLPALVWTIFALVYYGFPFANSAYAKLATGIPLRTSWAYGLSYFRNSWSWDPITQISIAVGLMLGLWRGGRRCRALLGGVCARAVAWPGHPRLAVPRPARRGPRMGCVPRGLHVRAGLDLREPLDQVFSLETNRIGLLVAALFGLTPELVVGALRKQTDTIKKELSSTEAAASGPLIESVAR